MSLNAFALRGCVKGEAHTAHLINASQHAVRHYIVASVRGIPIQGRLGFDRVGCRVSAVSNYSSEARFLMGTLPKKKFVCVCVL